MTPRYLRQPDAAAYLGVSVTHFTRHVRRELREVKIGGVHERYAPADLREIRDALELLVTVRPERATLLRAVR